MATVDLLLVGREGNGKSSTGNSILNQKLFTPKTSGLQGLSDIVKKSAEVEGKLINVVDGLSIQDSSTDSKNNVLTMIELAEKSVSKFVNGCCAIIVVLRYGLRFTNQEKKALSIIRSLFGDNVIKNYGVIVMTYGDSFAIDVEGEGTTFETWCQNQTGDIRDLFRECGNRIVLFNNKANNTKIKEQFKNLMSKVEEIKKKMAPYNIKSFRDAKLGQRKLVVETKLPELQTKTNSVLDYVTKNLQKLDESVYSPSDNINELERLKYEIDKLKTFLKNEDEGTNSIHQLMLQLSIIEASISTKKERYQRKLEYDKIIPRSTTPPLIGNVISKKFLIICIGILIILMYLVYYFTKSNTIPSSEQKRYNSVVDN